MADADPQPVQTAPPTLLPKDDPAQAFADPLASLAAIPPATAPHRGDPAHAAPVLLADLPARLRHHLQSAPDTDSPLRLTLSPVELGPLRFDMAQSGDSITITLTVDRPETLDLLRRNSDALLTEFRQAGFATTSFAFAGSWGGGDRPPSRPQPPAQPDAPAAYAADSPSPGRSPIPRAGLDLRL